MKVFGIKSRVIELRVRVKQNAKIRVFRVYSLLDTELDFKLRFNLWGL